MNAYPKTTIPISINNYLSSIKLHIGSLENDENRMRMLADTGPAMNTRNLNYHLRVMYQCPETVEEYSKCRKDDVYDVVH